MSVDLFVALDQKDHIMPFSSTDAADLQAVINEAVERKIEPARRQEVRRCAPLLVELCIESRNRSHHQLVEDFRRVLGDHCMVDVAGDCAEHNIRSVEHCARMLTAEIEHYRRRRQRNGEWSDAPVPPQFFG